MPSVRPLLFSEEWDYLDVDVLRPARSGAVCITCQHFRYEVGMHCVTVLTCPIHQGLLPPGRASDQTVRSVGSSAGGGGWVVSRGGVTCVLGICRLPLRELPISFDGKGSGSLFLVLA